MRLRSILFTTAALSGCGADDSGEPMTHQALDTSEHIDELRAVAVAHFTESMSAPTLEALQSLEADHQSMSGEHMDEIEHGLEDMMTCENDDGHGFDGHDGMMDMHHMCDSELDDHSAAIAGATDLAAALAEEERHHGAMMGMLDGLDEMSDEMMDMAGDFMCMGHHGMDDHEDG